MLQPLWSLFFTVGTALQATGGIFLLVADFLESWGEPSIIQLGALSTIVYLSTKVAEVGSAFHTVVRAVSAFLN
jgi:hypothetical protein